MMSYVTHKPKQQGEKKMLKLHLEERNKFRTKKARIITTRANKSARKINII